MPYNSSIYPVLKELLSSPSGVNVTVPCRLYADGFIRISGNSIIQIYNANSAQPGDIVESDIVTVGKMPPRDIPEMLSNLDFSQGFDSRFEIGTYFETTIAFPLEIGADSQSLVTYFDIFDKDKPNFFFINGGNLGSGNPEEPNFYESVMRFGYDWSAGGPGGTIRSVLFSWADPLTGTFYENSWDSDETDSASASLSLVLSRPEFNIPTGRIVQATFFSNLVRVSNETYARVGPPIFRVPAGKDIFQGFSDFTTWSFDGGFHDLQTVSSSGGKVSNATARAVGLAFVFSIGIRMINPNNPPQ